MISSSSFNHAAAFVVILYWSSENSQAMIFFNVS